MMPPLQAASSMLQFTVQLNSRRCPAVYYFVHCQPRYVTSLKLGDVRQKLGHLCNHNWRATGVYDYLGQINRLL